MPALGSRQEWALQSMRGYTTPSSNGILTTQTNGTVETKQVAMESMTFSDIDDNHENYSGEGKDHVEKSYSLSEVSILQSSPLRGISGEENNTDGSGGNDLFFSSSQTKLGTLEASKEQSVLIQTTAQWELLDPPTGQPSLALVSKDAMAPEEARGEVLYMHRPTEKSAHTPFHMIKVPLVKRKLSTREPNPSEILTPYAVTTSELSFKFSSATDRTASGSTMTTVDSLIQITEETTAENTVYATDPAISVSLLPVVQEETQEPHTHESTAETGVRPETTSNTVQHTTQYVKETLQQADTEPETQLAPTTASTSGDNPSQTRVDYGNDLSASGEFLLRCFVIHSDTSMISCSLWSTIIYIKRKPHLSYLACFLSLLSPLPLFATSRMNVNKEGACHWIETAPNSFEGQE